LQAALKNAKTSEQQFAERKSMIAGYRKRDTEKTGLRSDVVTLYQGGDTGFIVIRSIRMCAWY